MMSNIAQQSRIFDGLCLVLLRLGLGRTRVLLASQFGGALRFRPLWNVHEQAYWFSTLPALRVGRDWFDTLLKRFHRFDLYVSVRARGVVVSSTYQAQAEGVLIRTNGRCAGTATVSRLCKEAS